MNASRQKALRKRKADDPPIDQPKWQATARSAVAKVEAATRTANKKHQKEQQQYSFRDAVGEWREHSRNFIQNIIGKLKEEGSFTPRGRHELLGASPSFHYCSYECVVATGSPEV